MTTDTSIWSATETSVVSCGCYGSSLTESSLGSETAMPSWDVASVATEVGSSPSKGIHIFRP